MRTGTAVSCGVVYCNVPFIAGILILNLCHSGQSSNYTSIND